jgi:hypothetical protein
MYKLIKNKLTGNVENIETNNAQFKILIPFNPDNTDYQQYLEWVAAGNTPEPADTPE